MFCSAFKLYSNFSFNKSTLQELFLFYGFMVIIWSQYLSALPEKLFKYFLWFYGVTNALKLKILQNILQNSLIKILAYHCSNLIFLNCYLAAPRPTLGHCRGGRLTNPKLITAFFIYFDPKVTGSLVTRLVPKAWQSTTWGLNQDPSDS